MNWVENAHQLFLRRKPGMAKFRQSKLLQKFAWAHARIHNPVNQGRHLGSRPYFKALRSITLAGWHQLATCPHYVMTFVVQLVFPWTTPEVASLTKGMR